MLDDLAMLLLCRLDILLRSIQRLVLPRFAREEDQARVVGFEALDVHGDVFLGEVGAARVDGDADCGGELAGYVGFLLCHTRS